VEQARHSPVVWFALLEHARQTGDGELLREARESLLRHGIVVRHVGRSRHAGSGLVRRTQ
jgi:hypothetical protein